MDNLLPEIRFKKFKNNWSTEKIENLFTISAGGDIDKDNFSKKKNKTFKYPVYANSHLNGGLYGYSDLFKQEANQITVTGRGSIGKPEVRYTKFYPIIRLLILKPKREINLEFFKNLISRTNFYIESTGVPQLTAPQISKYKFNFPSLEEQQKIGSFLTSVDDKIALLTKKKELLEQYKKGVMQKIFSQEIRFQDDNGNDFPDWEEDRISNLLEKPISDGPHSTPKFIKDGVPFLSVNNIVNNKIDLRNIRYISYEDHKLFSKKCKPEKGDILLGKAATVGCVAIVETDLDINVWSPLAVIKMSLKNDSVFFYYAFQTSSIQKQIKRLINSSSQANIGMRDISKLEFRYPIKREQRKIANFLSALDSKIELVNSQIDKTKEFKKGLLQQMFV